MKALMQSRYDVFKNIGGDTIQMIKTKEELEKLGVEVDISLELEPDVTNYDLVHLFNITRVHETWMQFKNAKRQGKKVVLSTIHHRKSEIDEYEKKALKSTAGFMKKIFNSENKLQLVKTLFYTIQSKAPLKGFINQAKVGFINQQKEVIKGVDLLLPNSKSEYEAILEDFKENKIEHKVVVNGVEIDKNLEKVDENIFLKKCSIKEFIFCPGRIEPRKNQIAIINATKELNIPIIFAGALNMKHKKYCKDFLEYVKKNANIHYVGLLDREQIFSAYKLAKVTVLASWFETTGLVGLEAAIMDCNLVITEKGYTYDYYKDYVWYCNPESIESIKSSIVNAYYSSINNEKFKIEIKNTYSWENAALQTKEAYERILNNENL